MEVFSRVPDPGKGRSPGSQIRLAVSLVIVGVILVPGVLLLREGVAPAAGQSLILLLVFVLPAWRIDSMAHVARSWWSLTAWVLAGTLLWDIWTASMGNRPLLSEWPLVYSSSLIVFFLLFLLQGVLVGVVCRWNNGPAQR